MVEIRENWDSTWSLFLDGEEIVARKSKEEIEEKKTYLETRLKLRDLQEKVDTIPPVE
jgi:hypothetical protein